MEWHSIIAITFFIGSVSIIFIHILYAELSLKFKINKIVKKYEELNFDERMKLLDEDLEHVKKFILNEDVILGEKKNE